MAEQKRDEKSSDLDCCIQFPTHRNPAPSPRPLPINDIFPKIKTPNETLLCFNDSDWKMFEKIRLKYGDKLKGFYPDDITRFVQGYSHEKQRVIETFKHIEDLIKRGFEPEIYCTSDMKEDKKQYDFQQILDGPMDNNEEEESLKAWPVFMYGYDDEGHPVMYDEIGSSDPNELDKCFDGKMRKLKIFRFRVLRRLQNTKRIQNMRYGYDASVNNKGGFNAITKHVIVMNLNNFHAKSLSAKYRNLVRGIINDESNLWPNTLEKMYIINAPWPFRFAWKIIQNFIHPITAKKIDILGTDYLKTMTKTISLDQIPTQYGGTCQLPIKYGYTADIDNDILDGDYCTQSDPINLETIPCIKNRKKSNQIKQENDVKSNDVHDKVTGVISMEDRIKIGHQKFQDNTDEKGDDEKENTLIHKALIQRLTENPLPPSSSNEVSETSNNPCYDMISFEQLRYVITDLIQTHNKKFDEQEIVSNFMIHKLLIKWKTNLSKLYLALLEEYKYKNKISSKEINENIATHRFSKEYKIDKRLGRGAYAVVKLVSRITDNKQFAAKIINKKGLNKCDLRGLRLEIAIMRDLHHDNIVKLYDVYESPDKICLILSLLKGAELLDVIIGKGSFSEHEAAQCFAQFCVALHYIHSKRIAHRDIKPDNFLFVNKINDLSNLPNDALKLIDFGLSEKVHKNTNRGLTEYCGTPIYMAPEIFDHKQYDYSCDMWSIGCILYALLVGYPPFDFDEDHDINALSKSIRNDPIDFDPEYWSEISDDAKDLIRKLLERNPTKRYTAKQALNHKWMQSASEDLFDQQRMDRLRKFAYVRKMKRGVNAMIAVIRLSEIFEWFSQQKEKSDKN